MSKEKVQWMTHTLYGNVEITGEKEKDQGIWMLHLFSIHRSVHHPCPALSLLSLSLTLSPFSLSFFKCILSPFHFPSHTLLVWSPCFFTPSHPLSHLITFDFHFYLYNQHRNTLFFPYAFHMHFCNAFGLYILYMYVFFRMVVITKDRRGKKT